MNLLATSLFINFIIIVSLNKKMEQVPLSRRIVGGTEASVEDYPFICCIVVKFKEPAISIFSGGGAIIGKFWAITAAHCVYDFNDGIISSERGFVRGNTTYWDYEREGVREHLIVRYVIHEDYKTDLEDNDIALLQVREPFDGLFEKPILFAPSNYEYNISSIAIAMGWGTTKESVEPYTVSELRHVEVNIMKHQLCYQLFGQHNISFTTRMLCCGAPNKDACINDSGGPLIQYTEDNQKALLIGIISWGIDCASPVFPGVYVKVSKFNQWIGNRLHHHHKHPPVAEDYDADSDETNTTKRDAYDIYDIYGST